MSNGGSKYYNIWQDLLKWIERNDYMSFDVCDNTSTKMYMSMQYIYKRFKYGKYFYFPFRMLSQHLPNTLRTISGTTKKEYSQAYSIIARALLKAYDTHRKDELIEKADHSLQKLIALKNHQYKHNCWGQPYDWFSRKKIPTNTPRTTVTSQAAAAFLDMYEITKNEKYLEEAISAAYFFSEYMRYYEDQDGDICFPYTALDNYKIHNANTLAASILFRVYYYTGLDHFKDLSLRSFRFSMKHQTTDGSWYYWAPPDKLVYRIDNYHTGFILESLLDLKKYQKNEFEYETNLYNGLTFYIDKLFTKDGIPMMTPQSIFPIDIQSCAQAMITLSEASQFYFSPVNLLEKVSDWTINNLYNEKEKYFYYRMYEHSRLDKNAYIRWAESWMLRALSYLI